MSILLALLLAAQAPATSQAAPLPPAQGSCRPVPPPPAAHRVRIASLLASATGANAAAAYRVRSIAEEYELLGALGLCRGMQALSIQGNHPYDILTATDPRTGATRELWFDIASFYGHEF